MLIQNYEKTFYALLGLFLVAYLSSSNAQNKQFAVKGVTEISGAVSYSNFTSVSNGETGNAFSIFTFAPQIGYFVTDGFELSLGTGISFIPGFSVISPEDEESTNLLQFFFSPGYNIHTNNSTLFPFVETQLGYTSSSSGNNTQSGFSYGGRIGLKIIPVEHFLISFSGSVSSYYS